MAIQDEYTVTIMNRWWASLSICKKEAISNYPYPRCTEWWNNLDIKAKQEIYTSLELQKKNIELHLEKWTFSY